MRDERANLRGSVLGTSLLVMLTASFSIQAADAAKSLQDMLTKRGYQVGEKVERVSDYDIDGFQTLDDQHIILNAGPGRNYLITTQGSCVGLSFKEQVGFTTTPPNDLTPFDSLKIGGDDAVPQQCPIAQIQKLEKLKKP